MLKLTYILLLVLLQSACAVKHSVFKVHKNPIFEDNFNATQLDTTKWNIAVNNKGGGNQELQYYTNRSQNIQIKNGKLHLNALKENYKDRQYTSARINTKNKFSFKYGRVNVRGKVCNGKGLWPAFWLLPTHEKYGKWPLSGEIDIMEVLGNYPDTLFGTLHYADTLGKRIYQSGKKINHKKNGYAGKFHTYSIVWQQNTITWLCDNVPYYTVTKNSILPNHYPFNQEFYLIINFAIGGNWPGKPDDKYLPAQLIVDKISVYQ